MSTTDEEVAVIAEERRYYKEGFVTDVEQDVIPPG